MNRLAKRLIVSALFLLLALPTVALAQQASRGDDRGSNGRGHDNDRGRNNDRGRDNDRGRNNGSGYNYSPRPPRGQTAPVPEPSAALVFAGGLLAARYAGRRRP
jgi:hypothetical protein